MDVNTEHGETTSPIEDWGEFEFLRTPERERIARESFLCHRSTPHVTPSEHLFSKILSLGKRLRSCKKVYLDMNHWIDLREVELGRPAERVHQELLSVLTGLVSQGRIICPLSDYTWMELFKQSAEDTRNATAAVMDRLSRGVTLRSTKERMGVELMRFLLRYSSHTQESTFEVRDAVWTKVGYVLGHYLPKADALPQFHLHRLAKEYTDMFWTLSLQDLLAVAGTNPHGIPLFREADVEGVNSVKQERADELKSFHSAFKQELEGTIGSYEDVFKSTLQEFYRSTTGSTVTPDEPEQFGHVRMFQNLILHAILKKAKQTELPTISINALLFAAYRWDKRRKFTGSDISDYGHAVGALPYCEAFFTDGPLKAVITSGNLRLNQTYGTQIAATAHEMLDCLERMA